MTDVSPGATLRERSGGPDFPDDVDVAVVSHNGRTTLPRVFACLLAAGVPASRLTLYDISSTDGTADWLAAEWPAIRVRTLPVNAGPNPARNLAIADATRPYLLLVDSDAYLDAAAPTALVARARTSQYIGAVVPIVVHDADASRIQYAGSSLHFVCEAITPWADRSVTERGSGVTDIGTAPGVCFLLNVAAARRVGMFDARYFMGKEDGEFCYRLRLAGYRLVETPAAVARHGSRPRTRWLFPFQIRNRWHFMLKNYQWQTLALLVPILAVHEPVQLAILLAKGEGRAWLQACRGLAVWLPDLARDRREVCAMRRISDRQLLDSAPLVIRADVVGSQWARAAKSIYDRWLAGYWAVASRVLP